MNITPIWELSQNEDLSSLRRRYDYSKAFFIAFLVAFVFQIIAILRVVIFEFGFKILFEILVWGILSILCWRSCASMNKYEWAIEIKENKMSKSKALNYLGDMVTAI